jgi:acyl carrier protein
MEGFMLAQSGEPLVSGDAARKLLIAEMAAILHIDESQIDTSKPFDEYGLDSTEAIVVIGLVEEQIGMELEPELLLRYRTIDEVVNALRRLGKLS